MQCRDNLSTVQIAQSGRLESRKKRGWNAQERESPSKTRPEPRVSSERMPARGSPAIINVAEGTAPCTRGQSTKTLACPRRKPAKSLYRECSSPNRKQRWGPDEERTRKARPIRPPAAFDSRGARDIVQPRGISRALKAIVIDVVPSARLGAQPIVLREEKPFVQYPCFRELLAPGTSRFWRRNAQTARQKPLRCPSHKRATRANKPPRPTTQEDHDVRTAFSSSLI